VCDPHEGGTFGELIEGAGRWPGNIRGYVLKIDPDIRSDDGEFLELAGRLGFRTGGGEKNFEAIQPRYVFRLYLGGRGEEEIMASFHSKTRYNIRVAQKSGVQVRIEGAGALGDFHRLMLETGVRAGL
jgi:lipid II:glycine glycyltransferase (peptidoglycan interpeptide bridge formation enzyme)